LQVKVMNQPIQTLNTQYCSAEQQKQLELSEAEWAALIETSPQTHQEDAQTT